MGRTKRGKKIKKATTDEEEYNSDEGLNPESDDFFHDAVDKFHNNREKIMLEEEQPSDEEESEVDNEDIMGLDLEESDDEDDDDAEDEESEEEKSDEESKLPSDKSWGKKKTAFYNADTTDANIGSNEEAWELEKQEEEAALVLQQRMAATLDEEDFDVADFQIPESIDEEKDDGSEEKKTVAMDLSKLTKEQKLEILFRDSPELFELLEEFNTKIEEVTSMLSPLIEIVKLGKIPPEGAKYLELKHQLYLNYCINIGFYLLMKARQTPVKGHPVIERIVQYRTLIKELEPLDKELESDIEMLLANKEELLKQQDTIQESKKQEMGKRSKTRKNIDTRQNRLSKKKISALLDESEDEDLQVEEENEPPKKKPKKRGLERYSDPLQYYEKVRLEKKQAKEMKNISSARMSRESDVEEDDTGGNEDAKRAITYQISKNKGLTSKKKKQDRNPRVKHRKKFTKAVVKRKSQVRPVVTESNRYEGEKSGIRAFLTRSVKIK